jgi:hypothetical protein
MRPALRRVAASVLVVGVVSAMGVSPAMAQPPTNDTEGNAVVVDDVPFTHSQDTSEAAPDGPRFCSNSASVFFSFTPSQDMRVQVDAIGSDFDTVLGVYRRDATGRVRPVTCNDDRFGLDSGLRFHASAGTGYVFMVGQCCGNGGGGGGELVLTVTEVSDTALAYSIDVDDPSAVDTSTGIATITGTATCNERSLVYREGVLRQLRQGIFVARGFWAVEVPCSPGAPAVWSVEVDTDTGIAFGAGAAVIRNSFTASTDGFREFDSAEVADETIQLA